MSVVDEKRRVADLIVGDSPEIRRVRDLIVRLAPNDLPVLIEGPTGAGKELVACALHAVSGRTGAYVAVNVCAIPDGTFESALFGHVKGAFTGAVTDGVGFLTEAHRGTLFLDEIGGLGLAGQAKLLRAIETGHFRPVGARHDQRSQFRVVAASNTSLHVMVERAEFRADLAQRLRGIAITLPPLASRLDDVPLLVGHFLSRADRRGVTFDNPAMELLQMHNWPGNVRELFHVVQCAVTLADCDRVDARLISAVLSQAPSSRLSRRNAEDRSRLLEVLRSVEWNVNEAARLLCVHRATLYRRMRRAGIRTLLPAQDSWRGDADASDEPRPLLRYTQ